MCDYCGCREVPLVGELMSEHRQLQDEADHILRTLAGGDGDAVPALLHRLVSHLARHVAREENGIFAALRTQGDYAAEILDLESEHRGLDARISALDPGSREFDGTLRRLFAALEAHIEREDLGIFPVSVVSLSADEWDLVHRAHDATPTFLDDIAALDPSVS